MEKKSNRKKNGTSLHTDWYQDVGMRSVYLAIVLQWACHASCFLSAAQLARKTGLSVSAAKRRLSLLRCSGDLECVPGRPSEWFPGDPSKDQDPRLERSWDWQAYTALLSHADRAGLKVLSAILDRSAWIVFLHLHLQDLRCGWVTISREELANSCALSVQQVRTVLQNLETILVLERKPGSRPMQVRVLYPLCGPVCEPKPARTAADRAGMENAIGRTDYPVVPAGNGPCCEPSATNGMTVPPAPGPGDWEVIAYASERRMDIDPMDFYAVMTEQGWKDRTGKPIKNWKALMDSWQRRYDLEKKCMDLRHF